MKLALELTLNNDYWVTEGVGPPIWKKQKTADIFYITWYYNKRSNGLATLQFTANWFSVVRCQAGEIIRCGCIFFTRRPTAAVFSFPLDCEPHVCVQYVSFYLCADAHWLGRECEYLRQWSDWHISEKAADSSGALWKLPIWVKIRNIKCWRKYTENDIHLKINSSHA